MSESVTTQEAPTQAPATPAAKVESTEALKSAPVATPEAGKAAETKQEKVENAIRAMELTIRGQKRQVNLDDPHDLEFLKKIAQKGESADQKFNDAYHMRQQAEEFIKLLKTDPIAVLSHPSVGLDVRKFAEEFLYQRLQEDKLTPEQKEALGLKKELEEYKKRERESAEAKKAAEFEAAKAEYKGKLTEEIIKVLETSQLPKSPRTVARMAHYILEAKRRGWTDVHPNDVVDMVWEDYIQEHNELMGALPGERLAKFMSEDLRKKLRELDAQLIKQPGVRVKAEDQPKGDPENPRRSNKRLSKDEFNKLLDERAGLAE